VAGNWQYNVIYDYMNGTPTPMPTPFHYVTLRCRAANKVTISGSIPVRNWTNGTRSGCSSASAPTTWLQLAPNQFRVASTYFPNIRNDWKPNFNMSVFKQFPVNERIKAELRAESST